MAERYRSPRRPNSICYGLFGYRPSTNTPPYALASFFVCLQAPLLDRFESYHLVDGAMFFGRSLDFFGPSLRIDHFFDLLGVVSLYSFFDRTYR